MIQQGLTRHGTLDDKKAFSSLVSLILIVEHWKSEPTRASCVRLSVSAVRTELRQLDGEHQAAAVVRPEGEPALQGLPEVHLPAEGAYRARRVQVHTRSRHCAITIFTLGSDTPDMPDTNGRNLFQRCVIVKHNPCIITYNQVHHQHGGLQAGRHGGDVHPTSKG